MSQSVHSVRPRHSSSRSKRYRVCVCLLIVLIGSTSFDDWATLAYGAAHQQGGSNNGIAASAQQQIAALLAEKEARTTVEQKIDSNLLYAVRQQTGRAAANGVQGIETGIAIDDQSATEVDIRARVSDRLLARLAANGAQVHFSNARFRSVRAHVALNQIEAIAADSDVLFIQPKQEAETVDQALRNRQGTDGPRSDFASRAARIRSQLTRSLPRRATQPATPNAADPNALNTSEGVVTHRADLVQKTYGVIGAGIKIGVLSDGVSSLRTIQHLGDLPLNVTVLPGQGGSGDEGTAMLEIVHDVAPGAQLYFASAFGGIASFAQNILDLRAAGCDIIVDDVNYFAENPFQTGQTDSVIATTNGGIITEVVNEVTADGALYFSSAGNSGNKNDGTSGVWEGDFASGGTVTSPIGGSGEVHTFNNNSATTYDVVTAAASSAPTTLFWSDPLGGSSNDYDMFVLNAAGTAIVRLSTNTQNGTQDPFEAVTTPGANTRVVVVRRAGAASRYLHVNTNRGRLQFNTPGQTYAHAATAINGFGVAATPVGAAFPNAFTAADVVETFSSDGPRKVFYNANSSPITPGNALATGGTTLQKPDITAADGVQCAAPGFNPFFGTSAAAPHAAAIAALVKSAQPTLSPAEIRALLTSTAIDIEAPGIDQDSGSGIVDAFAAVQSSGATPVAYMSLAALQAAEGTLANNNGFVEPGEIVSITAQLANPTATDATDVQAMLALASPVAGVNIITPGPVTIGTVAANSTGSNTTAPFLVALSPSVACGTTLRFAVTLTYSNGGGNSPQTVVGSILVGQTFGVDTTLDGTAPPVVSGFYTASTGSQTGRLSRNGTPSDCANVKTNPGLFMGTGARRYDRYTLTNTSDSPTCVTVALASAQGNELLATAYTNAGFVPADPATNYLGDSGTSAPSSVFSFVVPANQSFTVVVHEVSPNSADGAAYALTITGTGIGTCAAPPPQPATIGATAGTPQETPVNSAFATSLQATVRDSSGVAVAGVPVTFSAPASGPSGTFPAGNSATTDANGQASVTFRANGTVGSYTVSASSPLLSTQAAFALTNNAVAPDSITATDGTPQSAEINSAFATSLQATVRNANGNLLAGIVVTFRAPTSGPSGVFPAGSSATTDANGRASVAFLANDTVGSYSVTANIQPALAADATFALTNTPGTSIETTINLYMPLVIKTRTPSETR